MARKSIYRIRPRGFCAGVSRAIEIVELTLDICGRPVYVLHEIVHNRHVVQELAAKGAVFISQIEDVPLDATLVFSAHGVSPSLHRAASARHLRVIDATCPLVTKVHLEALRFARQGYSILLIGDPSHDEVLGTYGEAPHRIQIITNVEDVDTVSVPDPQRVAYLTQTTLSLYDTAGIIARLRERFPNIKGPPAEDICYATQNRQQALEEIARAVNLVLVVGSKNSANSNRLVEVAERKGVRAHLIEDEDSIDPTWLEGVENVALTAGASAPEKIIELVTHRLKQSGFTWVEDIDVLTENIHFKLPPELYVPPSSKVRLAS